MATLKFKEESPFAQINDRFHHESDHKYQKYTDGLGDPNAKSVLPVKLALFGLGRAGSIHLSNIVGNAEIELLFIVEADDSKWGQCREQWNLKNVKFVLPENADEVYKSSEVEAVLVATPTATHEGIIVGSLEGGKAVFCEKPVSESEEGTARCYELAEKVGKPLFCAFNRRFDPSFSSVQRQVRDGKVGQVHLVKTTSRDSPLPSLNYLKISGGIFHDCAVHDIDLVTWTLGEYPTEVYSAATALIPEIKAIDDFDNVTITMKFPSEALALIDLSRFSPYGYDQRLEVFGPKGMMHVTNDKPSNAITSTVEGASSVPMYYSFPSRHQDGYKIELKHFVKVVRGLEPISVTGRMTQAVSKIASACEESAKSGKPVKLTWTKDEICGESDPIRLP